MKKTFTEEELEGADEDEQEEQLQPEYGAKKRGADALPQPQRNLEDASNSDDDTPEVFSMTEGKSMAHQRKSEEKASRRRIAAEVKKKKQERAASRQNEKTSGKSGSSPLKELKTGKDDANTAQSNLNGLLDDSIVQFLSAREKVELDEVKLESSPPEEPIKVKRLKSRKEKINSRVEVIDLSRDVSFVGERNALEFKHGHLYGHRIKRDTSMLRKTARVP